MRAQANLIQTKFNEIHQYLGIKYRIDFARGYMSRFGIFGAFRTFYALRNADPNGSLLSICLPNIQQPIKVRPATADVSTFEKIFIWNQYDLAYPNDVLNVIDGGANIGLSSILFSRLFPLARIFSLEPNTGNHELLVGNAAGYSNIQCLKAAIWSHNTDLWLTNPAGRVDSFQYDQQQSTASEVVKGHDIDSLMERFSIETLDVLKLDIEGAEKAVFMSNRKKWLDRTRMIIIELHGDDAKCIFDNSIVSSQWRREIRGENDVLYRNTF